MPLLDAPWKNALLGLSLLKNPSLLQQVQQQKNLEQQRARQAEEDARRRQREDFAFQQQQDLQAGRQGISNLLYNQATAGGPPTPQSLVPSLLAQSGDIPGAMQAGGLLAQPQPKPTGLMQEAQALYGVGTPEYNEFIKNVRLKPDTVIDMGQKFGSVPSGAVREEKNGETVIRYLPGSSEYEKRVEGFEGLESAENRLNQMSALINKYGTEIWPGEAKGTMSNLYGAILSDVAKARNLGVLQPGELDFIQMQIGNPSDINSLLVGKEGMTAQYKRQISELKSVMEVIRERLKKQGIKVKDTNRTSNIGRFTVEVIP